MLQQPSTDSPWSNSGLLEGHFQSEKVVTLEPQA